MSNRFDTTSDDFDRIVDAVDAVDYLDTQIISGNQFRDICRLLSLKVDSVAFGRVSGAGGFVSNRAVVQLLLPSLSPKKVADLLQGRPSRKAQSHWLLQAVDGRRRDGREEADEDEEEALGRWYDDHCDSRDTAGGLSLESLKREMGNIGYLDDLFLRYCPEMCRRRQEDIVAMKTIAFSDMLKHAKLPPAIAFWDDAPFVSPCSLLSPFYEEKVRPRALQQLTPEQAFRLATLTRILRQYGAVCVMKLCWPDALDANPNPEGQFTALLDSMLSVQTSTASAGLQYRRAVDVSRERLSRRLFLAMLEEGRLLRTDESTDSQRQAFQHRVDWCRSWEATRRLTPLRRRAGGHQAVEAASHAYGTPVPDDEGGASSVDELPFVADDASTASPAPGRTREGSSTHPTAQSMSSGIPTGLSFSSAEKKFLRMWKPPLSLVLTSAHRLHHFDVRLSTTSSAVLSPKPL